MAEPTYVPARTATFPYVGPVDLIKPPELTGLRKQCEGCGFVKDAGRFPRSSNRTRGGRSYRCHPCNAIYQRERLTARGGTTDRRTKDQARRRLVRAEAIRIYGGACEFCGATDDLEFDHVNGDGRAHRAEESPLTWMRRIAEEGYRDGRWKIRLLCRPHHVQLPTSRGGRWKGRRASALPA